MNNKKFKLALIFSDLIIVGLSLYISFLIRFEFEIPKNFLAVLFAWIPVFTIIQLGVFAFSGLYNRIWRYTSLFDLYAIFGSAATSCGLATIYVLFAMGSEGYPRSVLILYFIFNMLASSGVRLSVRIYYSHYNNSVLSKNKKPKKSLLLIGAGKTGEKIAREIIIQSTTQYAIAGFVDDNPEKHGALLHGKKVYGSVRDLLNIKVKYDEILITAPSATGDQMRQIIKVCKQTGKRYKTVPGIAELIDNEVTLDQVRDVSYVDLLGREEVNLDMHSIENLIHGKRVLITGAGGSIGSELVKQCLTFKPAEIVCLEISEEKIYNLELFIEKNNTHTIIKTVLASVIERLELDKVFLENRPHIVFHAAAYKHVPIQELHPWTAVKTNVQGTKNLVELADHYSVEKFVLVSTDKAVNPVNVMGATKRVAEKLIQSFNAKSETCYMSVRFGNVLGSSGSAIPTFQKQINSGGPITITHPEMTRYFMSIQEACQLILQCGAFGKDGEIFLLEMGKSIKIVQMAKDLIRLSGFEPEVDIPIVFTGLRPGEKLYEELQLNNEKKVLTNHKKIMILKDNEHFAPWSELNQNIRLLVESAKNLKPDEIQIYLQRMLPTYRSRNLKPIVDPKNLSYGIKADA